MSRVPFDREIPTPEVARLYRDKYERNATRMVKSNITRAKKNGYEWTVDKLTEVLDYLEKERE